MLDPLSRTDFGHAACSGTNCRGSDGLVRFSRNLEPMGFGNTSGTAQWRIAGDKKHCGRTLSAAIVPPNSQLSGGTQRQRRHVDSEGGRFRAWAILIAASFIVWRTDPIATY